MQNVTLQEMHFPRWTDGRWQLIDFRYVSSGWPVAGAEREWPEGFDASQLPAPKFQTGQRVEVRSSRGHNRFGEVQEIGMNRSMEEIHYVIRLDNGHVVPYCEEWIVPVA